MSISMIPKVKELKLISIYLYICDIYDSNLKSVVSVSVIIINPEFTDQEVMTIYLYVMQCRTTIKDKANTQFAMTIFVPGSHYSIL